MEKLPEQMQKDWVSWAFKHFKSTGSQAKFPELVQFVRDVSDEANSLYGKLFYGSNRMTTSQPVSLKKATVFINVASTDSEFRNKEIREVSCPLCEQNHKLSACGRFRRMGRERRVTYLARERRCFWCLEVGHRMDVCRSPQRCTIESCSDTRHHILLHRFERNRKDSGEKVVCGSVRHESRDDGPYFMTVPVKLQCNEGVLLTYALLDTGSQRSFCDVKLAEQLGAKGPIKQVSLSTLSSASGLDPISCREIDLTVTGLDSKESVALSKVLTVEKIPLRASAVPCRGSIKKFRHLRGIILSELPDKTVGLLIGLDASNLFRPLETRFGPVGTSDAIKTILGWTLFGPALDLNDYSESCVRSTCMHASLTSSSELDTSSPLENVQPNELTIANSRVDRVAYERIKNYIKIVDGHFQLPLLWKQEGLRLPKNRQMVENRLASLGKRLSRDTELHSKYTEVMESYLQKGYAEKVETNSDSAGSEWYLPHFPVFNPHKPEKLRIVFDCAAKSMGVSLNDALSQGPDLMNSLVGVLTRFRKESIALVADIQEMFHQVMVDPADRNYLKFL